jgi:hypothetical protein
MVKTYTTQFFRVSNGEVTTHNPKDLLGVSADIKILSAEARWEGITTTETQTSTDVASNGNNTGFQDSSIVSATIPAVPSGYDFLQHQYDIFIGDLDSGQSYDVGWTSPWEGDRSESGVASQSEFIGSGDTYGENYSGEAVTANRDPFGADFTIRISVVTKGERTTTQTTTKKTKYPRVTRDVSADSFEVLNDGERSDWVTLSGLDPDEEEFYHDIDGSGEARFQFRFDYEFSFPDAVRQLRIYDSEKSIINKVALADPSDSNLDYNHVRISEGGSTYAVDVVDPSDSDALSWFKIQTHKGVVSPRAFDQVSV